eukprot:336308-Prorocentrum_minimum.AAC.2
MGAGGGHRGHLGRIQEMLGGEGRAQLDVGYMPFGLGVVVIKPLQEHALELRLERCVLRGPPPLRVRARVHKVLQRGAPRDRRALSNPTFPKYSEVSVLPLATS